MPYQQQRRQHIGTDIISRKNHGERAIEGDCAGGHRVVVPVGRKRAARLVLGISSSSVRRASGKFFPVNNPAKSTTLEKISTANLRLENGAGRPIPAGAGR